MLKIIEEEGLQQNARAVGERMLSVLLRLREKHNIIGDVRGRGLMLAIELVKDAKTKKPAKEETARVFELTREMGLVMSKSGGYRNVLRMVPPLCLQMHDVEFFQQAIEESFRRL